MIVTLSVIQQLHTDKVYTIDMGHLYVCVFVILLANVATSFRIQASEVTEEFARDRIFTDYIKKLHGKAGDAQVANIYNMLKMYSQSTLDQTHHVVDYLLQHSNLTREEGKSLRMAGNSSVQISDCIRNGELRILGAYRNTGYNLHNCIRSAQMSFEKSYADLNVKIDFFKTKVVSTFNYYNGTIDNCLDQQCLVQTLAEAIVSYEKLDDELSKESMEGNNLNGRYILNSIAMTCVTTSITQIHQNYNTGKELLANCFHVKPTTTSQYGNPQQTRNGAQNINQQPQNGPQNINQQPQNGPQNINQQPQNGPQNTNQQSQNGAQNTNQQPLNGPQNYNQQPQNGPQTFNQNQNNQGYVANPNRQCNSAYGQQNQYRQPVQNQYSQQNPNRQNQYYGS